MIYIDGVPQAETAESGNGQTAIFDLVTSRKLLDSSGVHLVTFGVSQLQPQEAWTPELITTAAWYDASDATTITESGGKVSQWDDKSGNGNHASQATGTKQPITSSSTIGGLNAINFAAANDENLTVADNATLDMDGDDGVSMFAVIIQGSYLNQGSGLNGFISKGSTETSNNSYALLHGSGGKVRWKGGFDLIPTDTISEIGNEAIYGGVTEISTTTATLYRNGAVAATDTVGAGTGDNANDLMIGGDPTNGARYGNMDLGEVIIVAGPVSDTTRQLIEGYLAHKWGLTANLPVDHPYKNATPIA